LRRQLEEANKKMTEERDGVKKLNAFMVNKRVAEVEDLRRQLEEAHAIIKEEKDKLKCVKKEKYIESEDLRRQLENVNRRMIEERGELKSVEKKKYDEMEELCSQLEKSNTKMVEERDDSIKSNASIVNKTVAETQDLRRRVQEANSKIANLEESIQLGDEEKIKELKELKRDLEKVTREKADQVQKTRKIAKLLKTTLHVQSGHAEKIKELKALKRDLEKANREKAEQVQETRKIAKLLKTTIHSSSVTRVSRMRMDINLGYHDTKTGEYHQLPARSEYSGPVVDSKPHGAGMLKFECGDMYLGMFENGEINGEGSYITGPKRRRKDYSGKKKKKPPLLFRGLFNRNTFAPKETNQKN